MHTLAVLPLASPTLGGATARTPTGEAGFASQEAGSTAPALELDTASLAEGPYAIMSTLFEKTFLGIDVARVRVRFGPETAAELRRLLKGREPAEELADSAARVAVHAEDVFSEIEFQRDVSLERYLEATDRNMRKAMKAGILGGAAFWRISRELPRSYSAVEGRGMKEGDRLLYRIRGDSLRVVLLSYREEVLLDRTDVGPERRLAVLGGYLAPGADFREGLIESLFER